MTIAAEPDWTRARDHVIVCGLHDEGLRLVEQLHAAGVHVVVIDQDPDGGLVAELGALGIDWRAADARSPETLRAAGVATASALVCVESDDLRTLATALLASSLRPDLRIVGQLRNASVGRALSDIGVHVLDVASIAAPSVVDACLSVRDHRTVVGEQTLVITQTTAPRSDSLRSLYGDLAPLALHPVGAVDVEISPGRDRHVEQGDAVCLVGTVEQIGAAELLPAARPRATTYAGARAMRTEPGRPRGTTLVRHLVRTTDRRIQVVLTGLFALVAVSITVLMAGYRGPHGGRMSFLDALYFTTETVGTVGFGDFSFRDQADWLRVWAIFLMIVGATLATVLFALITNALVSRTLSRSLGQRRVSGMSDHVIVVGVGEVGLAVVEELRHRDIPVAVIESDEANRFLPRLRAAGVPVLFGDATLADTLALAQLARARAVAITTSDDLANVETGLAVRDLLGERWRDVPVVLRLFDPRLAHTVEGAFDFGHVRSPAVLAAPWFVGAVLGLSIEHTFYAVGRPMLHAQMAIRAGGVLEGTAMYDLPARLRVIAVERRDGAVISLPRRDTRFSPGDRVHVVGPYDELLLLLRTEAGSAV